MVDDRCFEIGYIRVDGAAAGNLSCGSSLVFTDMGNVVPRSSGYK